MAEGRGFVAGAKARFKPSGEEVKLLEAQAKYWWSVEVLTGPDAGEAKVVHVDDLLEPDPAGS